MACYRGWVGGWAGGGWGMEGAGGKPEVGQTLHEDTDSSAVCSVSDRKGLNPQDRSRQSLAAVWHQSTSLLVPPTGPTDPVLHYGGLTGSAISLQ